MGRELSWPYVADLYRYRQSNLKKTKLHRMSEGSSFLEGSFSNKDNIRASIQNSTPASKKIDFSSRSDPFIVMSIAVVLLD